MKKDKTLIYDKLVCFVGDDIKYSLSAIERLIEKKKNIIALVGNSSKIIYKKLVLRKKNLKKISLIEKNRFWEEKKCNNLYNKKTIGVNCGFNFIIPGSVIKKLKILNLHPAALPINRGCHHSFWGIMNKTILGATIHWMDKGIDTGPIINRKVFKDDGDMTAEEIQSKSNQMCLELLSENIDNIMCGTSKSLIQDKGTYHSKKEIIDASTIDFNDKIEVRYLYDLCRATCNKNNGFIVSKNGKKFLVRINRIEKID